MYVIEARQVAQSDSGLITSTEGKILKFDDEEKARVWGKDNLETARYVASWQAITETEARKRGHSIS